MIKMFFIPVVIMLSCGSIKSNQSAGKTDSAVVTEQPGDLNQKDSVIVMEDINAGLPKCMSNKIDSFKLKEAHEKPQRVVEYLYKNKKVYYVVMPCCDFFNEVYDDKCNYLGAPDGGFTGKGDGKIPDFTEQAKVVKTVWEASK